MLNTRSSAFWTSACLLWRNVYLHLLPIFWFSCLFIWHWVVWTVCIFWKLIPCQLHQLQTFSPFSRLSFGFVYGFLCAKSSSLISSHLFTFLFPLLWDKSKKVLLQFMSKSVLLMLSSRSLVSGLTFRSSIHFEFIFVYGVRECSNFIVLHVAVQFSQCHLLKRQSISTVHSYFLCFRLIDRKYMCIFLGSLSCSIDLCVFLKKSVWLL